MFWYFHRKDGWISFCIIFRNENLNKRYIHSTPEKVFAQMDDFSKTGMHLSESSMMMRGSKLKLAGLSTNVTGVGVSYRWYGMIMKINFNEIVTKGQLPKRIEWETTRRAKIIIISWYRRWFEITPAEKGAIAKYSIGYLPPLDWFYKIRSFFFEKWHYNYCLNNMLNFTKKELKKNFKQI